MRTFGRKEEESDNDVDVVDVVDGDDDDSDDDAAAGAGREHVPRAREKDASAPGISMWTLDDVIG